MVVLFYSCATEDDFDDFDPTPNTEHPIIPPPREIPNGYFSVNFTAGTIENGSTTKSTSGPDNRITHLRYIVYNAVTGDFVKEKIIFTAKDGIQSWPLQQVTDTLPKGSYKAIFLGNVEKSLFPYSTQSSQNNYSEVLSNYRDNYRNARISLPNTSFTSTTEYYWAKAEFSDQVPPPTVLLKRIINGMKIQRNFVDSKTALDKLVQNILTDGNYKNKIGAEVNLVLPGLLESNLGLIGSLGNLLLGRLVKALLDGLVKPITDALYNLLVERLTAEIGNMLVGNTNEAQLLEKLGILLNPWNGSASNSAIVTVQDFPKSVDFDLNVCELYSGQQRFKYEFPNKGINDEKYVTINSFNKEYKISDVNVANSGLISGLLVDGVIDDWLLPGIFVDIKDPLIVDQTQLNHRYMSNYSFADLKLKDNTGKGGITLALRIGDIANIQSILNKILGGFLLGFLLQPVTDAVLNISVSITVYLPGVSETNLLLTGSWDNLQPY